MFIFYFLGVGPPCCSILCQFWLCEEAQCVYLRRHLGSREFLITCFLLLDGGRQTLGIWLRMRLLYTFGFLSVSLHTVSREVPGNLEEQAGRYIM